MPQIMKTATPATQGGVPASAEGQGNAKIGTGVFMPLTSRVDEPGFAKERWKRSRRRNISTSALNPRPEQQRHHHIPGRSASSRDLRTPATTANGPRSSMDYRSTPVAGTDEPLLDLTYLPVAMNAEANPTAPCSSASAYDEHAAAVAAALAWPGSGTGPAAGATDGSARSMPLVGSTPGTLGVGQVLRSSMTDSLAVGSVSIHEPPPFSDGPIGASSPMLEAATVTSRLEGASSSSFKCVLTSFYGQGICAAAGDGAVLPASSSSSSRSADFGTPLLQPGSPGNISPGSSNGMTAGFQEFSPTRRVQGGLPSSSQLAVAASTSGSRLASTTAASLSYCEASAAAQQPSGNNGNANAHVSSGMWAMAATDMVPGHSAGQTGVMFGSTSRLAVQGHADGCAAVQMIGANANPLPQSARTDVNMQCGHPATSGDAVGHIHRQIEELLLKRQLLQMMQQHQQLQVQQLQQEQALQQQLMQLQLQQGGGGFLGQQQVDLLRGNSSMNSILSGAASMQSLFSVSAHSSQQQQQGGTQLSSGSSSGDSGLSGDVSLQDLLFHPAQHQQQLRVAPSGASGLSASSSGTQRLLQQEQQGIGHAMWGPTVSAPSDNPGLLRLELLQQQINAAYTPNTTAAGSGMHAQQQQPLQVHTASSNSSFNALPYAVNGFSSYSGTGGLVGGHPTMAAGSAFNVLPVQISNGFPCGVSNTSRPLDAHGLSLDMEGARSVGLWAPQTRASREEAAYNHLSNFDRRCNSPTPNHARHNLVIACNSILGG